MAAGQGEAANTNPLSASSVMSSLSRSFFGSQGARQQKQQQEEEEEEEEEEYHSFAPVRLPPPSSSIPPLCPKHSHITHNPGYR